MVVFTIQDIKVSGESQEHRTINTEVVYHAFNIPLAIAFRASFTFRLWRLPNNLYFQLGCRRHHTTLRCALFHRSLNAVTLTICGNFTTRLTEGQVLHQLMIQETYIDFSFSHLQWPPHINLVYPFVAPEQLPRAQQQIREYLAENLDQETPIDIELVQAGAFIQKNNMNVYLTDDGGEEIKVARIDEVENDGVERAFALLKPIGDLVISLLQGLSEPTTGSQPRANFAISGRWKHQTLYKTSYFVAFKERFLRSVAARGGLVDGGGAW